MSLLFLIGSIVAFVGIVVFGNDMTATETERLFAGGLAAFAAAHVGWPATWGFGARRK